MGSSPFIPEGIVVSSGNTTTAPLGAGGTFVGVVENVEAYTEISLNLAGTPAVGAPGTFYYEFGPDPAHLDVSVPIPVPGPGFVPQILRVVLPYFRVRYVNGGIPLTELRITTVYHRISAIRQTRYLNQPMDNTEPVQVVRAVAVGASPAGDYTNVPVTREGAFSVSVDDVGPRAQDRILGADRGVFGVAVVGQRVSQFRAAFFQPLSVQDIVSVVTGSGTILQPPGAVVLSTGVLPTASARIRTPGAIRYQIGREIYMMFTAAFTTPTSGNTDQRAGLYSDTDGFFLGYRGLTFGMTVRSGGVDTFTSLSMANEDTLSGAPDSRFTRGGVPEALNPVNLNVYRIRFGWLGSAPAYFGILSPDGVWVPFQVVRAPNLSPNPLILSPALSPTLEVVKTLADAQDLQVHSGAWDAGSLAGDLDSVIPSSKRAFTVGTTIIKAVPGRLRKVVVGKGGSGPSTVTLLDDGAIIAVIAGNVPGDYTYDVGFNVDLSVVLTGPSAPDVVVVYD